MSEDAPEDRDVKLQKVSGDLFAVFKDTLGKLLFSDVDGLNVSGRSNDGRAVRAEVPKQDVWSCIHVVSFNLSRLQL